MISHYGSHLPVCGGTSSAAGRQRGCWESTRTAPGRAGGRTAARGRRPQPPRQEASREPTPTAKRCAHAGTNASPAPCRGLSASPHPTGRRISHALLLFFRGRAEHGVFPDAARKAQGPAAALPARDPHPRAARPALSWVCRTHHPSPTLSVCPSCRSLITLKCINQTGTQANHPWKS